MSVAIRNVIFGGTAFVLLFSFISCDKILGQNDVSDRNIRVYLPPSYNTSPSKRYPVVYLLDGDQWNIDNLLNNYIKSGRFEDMIVVEIGSTERRTDDFLPYEDAYVRNTEASYTPNARKFADYIVGDLIPSTDRQYRTIADRDNRAIIGASYGGLFALWAGFNYESTFSMVGAMSPSFWVADFKVFDEIAAMPKKNIKVWFDTGTLEWDYNLPLADILVGKGATYGTDVVYYEVKNGKHDVLDWVARVHCPLIMFKGPPAKEMISFSTELEVIKSTMEANKYFLRLNPVVLMDNFLIYSAAQFASYQVLNPSDAIVYRDGSFDFLAIKDFRVRIGYQGIVDTVTVKYSEVQGMK
jgi:predicted alpha/beta superfamily hydrolase